MNTLAYITSSLAMIWNVQTKVSHEQIDGNSLCPTPYLGENTKIVFLICDSHNLWTSSRSCEYLKKCMYVCVFLKDPVFYVYTWSWKERISVAPKCGPATPDVMTAQTLQGFCQFTNSDWWKTKDFFQFPKGPPSWGASVNRPFFLSHCHFTRSISISLT